MLNYLAVAKIVKKHDKLSPLRLREAFATLVTLQPFYTSTQLAATFTHAQCIAAELLSAASGAAMAPESADYSCSICMEATRSPCLHPDPPPDPHPDPHPCPCFSLYPDPHLEPQP